MKQGTSNSSDGERKMEPMSRAVNPAGAGNLGLAQGNHADCGDLPMKMTPLYAGRGYEAPAIRSITNKSGSQGKY